VIVIRVFGSAERVIVKNAAMSNWTVFATAEDCESALDGFGIVFVVPDK
jgi:hypothetical protein